MNIISKKDPIKLNALKCNNTRIKFQPAGCIGWARFPKVKGQLLASSKIKTVIHLCQRHMAVTPGRSIPSFYFKKEMVEREREREKRKETNDGWAGVKNLMTCTIPKFNPTHLHGSNPTWICAMYPPKSFIISFLFPFLLILTAPLFFSLSHQTNSTHLSQI